MTNTKDLLPCQAVTRYRVADGSEHETAEKAKRYVEDNVGEKLQNIINSAGLDMGHSTTFQLCLYLMRNAPEVIETLQHLHTFEPDDGETCRG